MNVDRVVTAFDTALRTLAGNAVCRRRNPAAAIPQDLSDRTMKQEAANLMRVDHAGEVCAQALYQGQALVARQPELREALLAAGREEEDHLAWTRQRLDELGSRASLLDPLWYAGSFALGTVAGLAGDRWSLGFLAETERQVEAHLADHLQRLPRSDAKSRAILRQMKYDEGKHATQAIARGGADLPLPLRLAMQATARIMTRTAYHL